MSLKYEPSSEPLHMRVHTGDAVCSPAVSEYALVIDSGLVGSMDFWEGYRESRRCSRDTYPESYITKYTLVYEDKTQPVRS